MIECDLEFSEFRMIHHMFFSVVARESCHQNLSKRRRQTTPKLPRMFFWKLLGTSRWPRSGQTGRCHSKQNPRMHSFFACKPWPHMTCRVLGLGWRSFARMCISWGPWLLGVVPFCDLSLKIQRELNGTRLMVHARNSWKLFAVLRTFCVLWTSSVWGA